MIAAVLFVVLLVDVVCWLAYAHREHCGLCGTRLALTTLGLPEHHCPTCQPEHDWYGNRIASPERRHE